jgi:hypothetical protein
MDVITQLGIPAIAVAPAILIGIIIVMLIVLTFFNGSFTGFKSYYDTMPKDAQAPRAKKEITTEKK